MLMTLIEIFSDDTQSVK